MTSDQNLHRLLLPFLEAEGEYVSGEKLAEIAGVSRVSIWNRMNKLEESGFKFEAVRNRGYRLKQEPNFLHPALVAAYAQHFRCAVPIHVFESIDSTSSEVERRLISQEDSPFAVMASEQTRGRGRLGRNWESARVGNLYLSLAFKPTLSRDRMHTFTLWMGVNLARFLSQRLKLPIRIKWPNDILCQGKKVAGMLTEARVDNDRLKDLIFGLGLNINAESFPAELANRATSLRQLSGHPHPLHALSVEVLLCLLEAYHRVEADDITPELMQLWDTFDCLKEQPVALSNGVQNLTGVAEGIDRLGALCLRTESGSLEKIRAGDVSFNHHYPPGES